MTDSTEISFGHCPDPDDAFMFYALQENKIPTDPYQLDHVIEPIDRLNQRAQQKELVLSSVSVHAYAHLHHDYDLLSCGSNILDSGGPLLVGRKHLPRSELQKARVAIPGTLTTANLVLRLYAGKDVNTEVVPFDRIFQRVLQGDFDAGLIIDSNQVNLPGTDLVQIEDLGTWWKSQTRFPLPVGVCAVRSSREDGKSIGQIVKQSLDYSFEHRQEALVFASRYADELDPAHLEEYVQRYVNEHSLDLGSRGRRSIQTLLNRAYEEELIPEPVSPVFIQVD